LRLEVNWRNIGTKILNCQTSVCGVELSIVSFVKQKKAPFSVCLVFAVGFWWTVAVIVIDRAHCSPANNMLDFFWSSLNKENVGHLQQPPGHKQTTIRTNNIFFTSFFEERFSFWKMIENPAYEHLSFCFLSFRVFFSQEFLIRNIS